MGIGKAAMADKLQAGFGRMPAAMALDAAIRGADILFLKTAALDLTGYDAKRRRVKWGAQSIAVTGDGSGNATITYPVAFTEIIAVVAGGNVAVTVTAFTATTFTVHGAVGAFTVHYFVVGV